MIDDGPFSNDPELFARSAFVWRQAQESDLLEAFAAHPQIGDLESLQKNWASTKQLAGREQVGVEMADATVLARLADGNREYLIKFGFIFIVCATGKSADEMLALLEQRLPNDRTAELALAASEQLKITHLRLRKLVA
jgi:OHCU decarboxylase